MRLEEKNILDEMRKIRFLKNGIEEIELFESLNNKLREYYSLECIPDLCEIMEDDVENCSAVEGVLETILIFVKQNDMESALKKVIEGTLKMKGHGDSWSRILHTQLLGDKEIREVYVKCIRYTDGQEKESILEILEILKNKRRIKDMDMNELIESIR